jgi:hypothetical protein
LKAYQRSIETANKRI